MSSKAKIHRAISLLIEVEQELEDIDGARQHELQAARLRHALYSLLGFGHRDAAVGSNHH